MKHNESQERPVIVQSLHTKIAAQRDSGSDKATDRRTVLVVDDDQGLLRLLRLILSDDYDVTTAGNGSDALDIAEQQHVDVIVLDLRMPVLDGPAFFRELRARGDTTPVLVTSSVGARDAQRELGAEGAIEKPFEPDALLAAVDSLLR